MPLSAPSSRRPVHRRVIEMNAYQRDDGLYDVEAHLVDTKSHDFKRLSSPQPVPAGQPQHDMWVRLTVDDNLVVRAIEAASDEAPWAICKEAEASLSVLVGERLVRGWSAKVKERLRGAASCTHLMEVLIPLATTALQGIRGLKPEEFRLANEAHVAAKIDSCYAYGAHRPVVKMLWPQHYRPAEAGDSGRA